MRFTGIFTAVALAIGLTTALPASSASDTSITSRAEADTYYTVHQFNAAVYPNTNDVFYYLDIKGHSPDVNRRFGYSYCQVELKASELVPVTSAICASDTSVYFQLVKYTDDAGAFAGWKLIISHPYHENDMLMVDGAVKRFPKDLVMTKGKGKGCIGSLEVRGPSMSRLIAAEKGRHLDSDVLSCDEGGTGLILETSDDEGEDYRDDL